ncbi:MAG TPA: thermonuclease family protein [Nodularia sp. (in: cyanobacteria)]|nr:thermonuclease family protein [Nodularia sp. (in: cyanobacteria)]
MISRYSPLLALVSLALFGCNTQSSKPPPPTEDWIVTNISDGHSLTVRQTTGQEMKIRLCGIDAPKLDQPLGKESRDALRSLIASSDNEVMVSPVGQRDGRTVAEVFIILPDSEKFLNEEQISSGNAYLYKQDAGKCPNESTLENAEVIAQSKKLGLWSGFKAK